MKFTPSTPQVSDRAQPQVLKTKSPSPGPIDVDDRQPIPSATLTTLGEEVDVYGATAFVFTSSRTLRALRDQEQAHSHDQRRPNAFISSVPSPPFSPSMTHAPQPPLAQHTKTQRASLTLSQLDKHSEGAVSALSLLGPNMRAAGFVNLPRSRASQPPLGPSGAPSTSPHSCRILGDTFSTEPPPRNPPDFPPILFVKPSHVTTTPMWEYQSEMHSSPLMTEAGRVAQVFTTSSSVRSGEFAPSHRVSGTSSSSSSSRPLLSPPTDSELESSDPFFPPPSSTLLSSSSHSSFPMDKPLEHGGRSRPTEVGFHAQNGKAREWSAEPGERASPPSARSCGSRGSTATASPSLGIGGAIPPIARPSYSNSSVSSPVPEAPPDSTEVSSSDSSTAVSSSTSLSRPSIAKSPAASSPQRRRRSSEAKVMKSKAKTRISTGTAVMGTPSFSSAKRLGHQRPYSFTELCDRSSFMWTSKSDMFVPPAPIARASNVTAVTPSLSRPLATVEVREPPPPRPSRHPRRHAKEYGNISQISGRAHLIASAPLRSMIPSESDSSSEMDSEKAKARKPKKAVKCGDCPPIDKDTKGAPKFLVTVLPGMNTRDSSTGKKRGRDTRGKRLGASESPEDRAALLV